MQQQGVVHTETDRTPQFSFWPAKCRTGVERLIHNQTEWTSKMCNQRGISLGLLASLLVLPLASLGTVHAALIDDFSNASLSPGGLNPINVGGVNIVPAPGVANTVDTVGGVIGGTRAGQFTLISGAPGQLTAFVAGGVGSLNLSIGSTGTHQLTYDAAGVGLNANFSADLGLELFVALDLSAAVGTSFQVTLTDGDSSTHTQSILVTSTTPQVISFLFSGFSSPGGLNLADIDRIVLLVTPAINGDVMIDNFQQIPTPEPTSLAVWGCVVAAGWFAQRRFRQQRN